MAMVNTYENGIQWKTCRCGEGDTNIWTTRTSDNPDKQIQKCPNCQVLKSGPLFLSSKGIGWTSWKKRWFILTRTSLVFYRSDPNATPQKGSEVNLTLGGLDLNNSGSVVVKADKKLLTVLFPDGRDGRTFTLKAETSEDLFEWKTALENALAQSPSPALAMGQNGIFPGDKVDSVEASSDQLRDKDKQQVTSLVVGRPILLALEDIDGSPSFLEKALRFIEEHGISVEGILRQSADVEEVERRVREYEQGNDEFSASEDAHVVCDCIKLVLRELQSSPVPATCCTALVEAYRADRGSRINAMRAAIAETFPEPNRRLVQRILKMMQTVASHKSENRMSLSAVAACMAPLLLRPLLAGDCELEDDFDMGGDGSIQLLQAAAAANHAQAIVIILLEEYERIFDEDLLLEGSLSSDLYSESEDDDADDDESIDNDIMEDDEYNDPDNSFEADIEDDLECSSSGTLSESNSDIDNDSYDHKASDGQKSNTLSPIVTEVFEVIKTPLNSSQTPVLQETSADKHLQHAGVQNDGVLQGENSKPLVEFSGVSHESFSNVHTPKSSALKSVSHTSSSIGKCTKPLAGKRPAVWGRTSARKNLSMESIDFSSEDEFAIQRLEMTKSDLQNKIAKEVNGNIVLQASLEKRKDELQERRLALEQDLERLHEQLQKEIELRACLEAGLRNLQPGLLPITSSMDNKTRVDLEEIALAEEDIINLKQKVTDLREQLSHQRQHSLASLCKSCTQHLYSTYIALEKEQRKDVDSTMPVHRNENSSKIEVNAEDVKTQIPDSPASPNRQPLPAQNLNKTSQNEIISAGYISVSYAEEPSTFAHDGASKNSASRDVNPILGKNVKTQPQDPPSSPDEQFSQTLQSNTTNQSTMSSVVSTTFGHNTYSKESSTRGETLKKEHLFQSSKASLESSSISCADESATIVHDAASKMSASRDNNSMPGVVCENVKTRSLDSPSSPDKQFSQNLRTKTTNPSSKSLGSNRISCIEEHSTYGHGTVSKKRDETVNEERASRNMITAGPSTTTYAGEQKIMSHDALSKKPPSKDENSMLEEVSEEVKTQTQDSPSSPDKQSPQKLQPNTTNLSNAASKKSSFRADTIRKETQDPQSLTSRQFSEKQLLNTTNLNSMKSVGSSSLSSSEEMTTVGRSTAVKKSFTRGEETASTSSALTKLTNRLNFLKERRVQLVNELQNLYASRTSGTESLPRTNSM